MTITFKELGLAAPILKALDGQGYTNPTPIQAQAIPPVLKGSDILGIAQTGTGKTAAFALPILHRLMANPRPPMHKGCRVLVLSPTRELASQIAENFRAYGRHLNLSTTVVFGGVGHRPQIKAIARGVDVLVATPGRLLDHMQERNVILTGTEVLVLDEADQMLDLGFLKPIKRIVSQLSSRRQNLFFSATMPREIAGLANDMLNNPVKVAVAPVATTAERVTQRVIHIEAQRKRSLLAELLADPEMSRTLVFTRTKRGADRVARHLEQAGISASAIHGNKSQRQREIALEAFRKAKVSVLVATDIAARGIDVNAVSHVINYELPEVPEAYVHRIGRTARAGAAGSAISLCDPAERGLLRGIERLTRQTIDAQDRRNDQTLTADKIVDRGPRSPRNGSGRGQPSRGDGRQSPQRARTDGARKPSRRQNGGHDTGESANSNTTSLDTVSFMAKPSRKPNQQRRTDNSANSKRSGSPEGPRQNRAHNRPRRSSSAHRPAGAASRA